MRPIPILALVTLLLGFEGAASKNNCQDILPIDARSAVEPPLKLDASTFDVQADFALAVADKPVEAAHDQRDAAIEPPQSLTPAGADAGKEAADSVDNLCNALFSSAEENGLPVPFFANLIWRESRLQLDSVSRAGALGIAQFMPQVAVEVGLNNPFDPHQAIPASARLLHALREHFGNLGFVAAAYNAGAHRVAQWLDHRRALPRETRIYVMRVTGRSVEAWRKSPVDDSQLMFVQPLPCRKLPAFADLEAQQLEDARLQRNALREESAEKITRQGTDKAVPRLARRALKEAPLPRGRVAERNQTERQSCACANARQRSPQRPRRQA